MVAVFVVTQEMLYEKLADAGFSPTSEKTKSQTIWANKSGDLLSVNHIEPAFPIDYLNELLGVYGITATFQGEVVDLRKYKATPRG